MKNQRGFIDLRGLFDGLWILIPLAVVGAVTLIAVAIRGAYYLWTHISLVVT